MLLLWRQERMKTTAQQLPEWLAAFSLKINGSLDRLEQEAQALAQDGFDIGHVSVGCMLSYIDYRFPDLGWREAMRKDRALALGLNTHAGHVTYGPVAEAHGMAGVKLDEVLT